MIDVRDRYWEHRGYSSGTCMQDPDSSRIYINIPKNASSSIRQQLDSIGWQHSNISSIREYDDAIVILRDPVERWISGIAQHITTNLCGADLGSTHYLEQDTPLTQRVIFDQLVFDDHTERQTWFLEPFNLNKAVYFYCDKNLNNNIRHYLNTDLEQEFVNQSSDHFDNRTLVEYFKNLVYNNQDYLNRIKDFFQSDYEFINSVKFYDAR